MPRLQYVSRSELPPGDRAALDDPLATDTGPTADGEQVDGRSDRNVYRILAHDVDLLEGFQAFAGILWNESAIGPIERELVVLSVARLVDSAYVWHQHVRIAREVGVAPEHLDAVATGALDELDPRLEALVEYVRHLLDGTVTDEEHDRLAEHYDPEEIVGIGMLGGCYLGLARQLDALDVGVEADESFVGWDLDR